MAKKKKKRKVRLKIKNILIFLSIILIFLAVIYYVLQMPIKNIYISGNKILDDETVIELAKLSNYPSFLLTSTSEIKRNLSKSDYINNIKISKKLGNVIDIKVEEYKALALTNNGQRVILSSGKIIENKDNITDVPVLNNNISDKVFNYFIKKFSGVNDNILRQISQLEYSPVSVDDKRFLLYMDDGNMIYITLTKIDKLNKYNAIKDKMDNQTGLIYLDSGDYVELKDNKENITKQDDTSKENNDNVQASSSDNTSDNNFKNHTNTEYLLPVVASRYVFIRDNMDTNASEVKLYDLKDNKTVATYSTVSANILNNDNTLTFYDNEIKIIVKNKSNKYGLISLNSNGITKIYDFIYDSMERFGENYLVSSNGEYKVLYSSDSASLGYPGKIYDISGNYVVVKENDKFYLYKTDGSKVSDTGYKMIKLLGNTCYSYIDDSNTLIISTYDNTRVSTGFVISDTTNEFDLYNRYSLSNVSGSVLVNVFDSNNNRIHNETYDLKKNNEEKTE